MSDTTSIGKISVEQLSCSLNMLSSQFNGFGGNCASVAQVINEVVGSPNTYLAVSGDHYEFADHILVKWSNFYWDMDGPHSYEEVLETWADDGQELEEFTSSEGLSAMVDSNGLFSGGYDEGDFKNELLKSLSSPHVSMPSNKNRKIFK